MNWLNNVSLNMQTPDHNPHSIYLSQACTTLPPFGFSRKVSWQSPSNIAIVKYWGKYGLQLPQNPSISFTLREARTETAIDFHAKSKKGIRFRFLFDGREQPLFSDKIGQYLHALLSYFPFLEFMELEINSRNTFPHSSGIASSASAMSALVMCLLEIEQYLSGNDANQNHLIQKASYLSRLGSGSAARSVYPYAASWGSTRAIEGSSNYFASPLGGQLHEVFKTYRDSILIISGDEKKVSSRAGHQLMENNPFAGARYALANANTEKLLNVLQDGDLEKFCEITESEALQLHALMMTSVPSFMLMEPATISAIKIIQSFRKETRIPICFTLDAGPNIHLLYPQAKARQVKSLISDELIKYCNNGLWIDDQVGEGASKL
jgi:diphosphomevalonate decarboxylase